MSRMRALAIVVLLGAAPLRAGEKVLPTDLGLVPADAAGFVHVRVADVWKGESFKIYREIFEKAGNEALAAFDRRFAPSPSSIDRFTAYVRMPRPNDREPRLVMIVTTSRPINRDQFLQQLPDTVEEKSGNLRYHVSRGDLAVRFHDDRTLILGPAESVRDEIIAARVREGPLADAIQLAASGGKALVLAGNPSAIPEGALRQMPPMFQPLFKARLATVTMDLGKAESVDVRLSYASPANAEAAEQAARDGLAMARKMIAEPKQMLLRKVQGEDGPSTFEQLPEAAGALAALGALNQADELLATPPLTREESTLRIDVKFPPGLGNTPMILPVGIALLLPAVQKVRMAASRTQDMNNLKQMALAIHNYASTYRDLPSAAICDKNGRPLLSWRVTILPYIEQEHLYRQFKLDEPWDSEHNKKLIPLMPMLYTIPNGPKSGPGETHYRVFVGGGALFELDKKVKFSQITDGTSNTVMIVETADSVVWTKPEDIPYDAKKALPRFADFHGSRRFHVAFADGSVRTLRLDLPEETLRGVITRDGGEAVQIDD